ncbi:TPA: hypothetical protein ACH3X3_013571 [Trebouxia sp. C0006]
MAMKGALSVGRLSNSMVSRQALLKPRACVPRRGQSFSSSGAVLASMPPAGGPQPSPAGIPETRGKHDLVGQLLAAKEASGKTFTQISKEIGLTNAFTAQLFYNQAQLKSGREEVLRKACPALTDELVAAMKRAPMRGFDPSILKEPHIYRSYPNPPLPFKLQVQPVRITGVAYKILIGTLVLILTWPSLYTDWPATLFAE